jgi:hypothetical protein
MYNEPRRKRSISGNNLIEPNGQCKIAFMEVVVICHVVHHLKIYKDLGTSLSWKS